MTNPPPFHIGQEVETNTGRRFRITQVQQLPDEEREYSASYEAYYPASSLRLVDDGLKIGDYAKVVRPGNQSTWQIGQVSCVGELTVTLRDMGCWDRQHLRKLTPETVVRHTHQIGYRARGCQIKRKKSIDAIRNLLAPDVYERLATIEKKIDQFDGEIGHLNGSISECLIESGDVEARTICREKQIEERLAILEGEAPEVCDVPIEITIIRRGELPHNKVTCHPDAALAFCEHVLDSMQKDR
ncbi:MAG: hypothetical protein WC124_02200 [Desulfoplanes sp.]